MSSKRIMGKVAPAFEIRFNGTDSQAIESVPINPSINSNERNIPEPFRKRDKIPRYSGNASEHPINNVNIPPQKPSSVDVRTSPSTLNKQFTKNIGDSFHGSQLKTLKDVNNSSSSSSNATDIPTTKVKSWNNSVGPETEKQDRVTVGKIEKDAFMDNNNPDTSTTSSTIAFDSAIRISQSTKKRPLSEESGSEKENVDVDADNTIQTPYSNKDLNGTTEMTVSVNRKNTLKNNRKKKINTNDYKDDDDNNTVAKSHLSVDGIATPPATPPRSPPMTPIIAQTPPSSGPPMTPMTAHTPINNGPILETANVTTQTPLNGLISETVINESIHLLSPQPSDDSQIVDSTSMETTEAQIQQSRAPRMSKSRPIITAYSLELQEQLESESPTNDEPPKKTIISHDDMIIPTLAKKLKMNGQLPYPNHEALLGVSDEPDESDKIKPRPESGYMDVTDQVENLFEDANDQFEDELQKSTKKRSSVASYQRRRRKSAPRRPTRKSRPNSRRNSKTYSNVQIQTDDVIITPALEDVPFDDDLRKRDRKSRREEFVFLTKYNEDDIDIEPVTHSELPTSTMPAPLVPKQEPVEQNEMSKVITNNSFTAQNDRIHPVQSNVAPVATHDSPMWAL
ncbi:6987_t:CDS:2 [Dentiscutata erythropus]|uniref:6987_t:CDS:1 n=1 Tax=Dentiscutata erythropus TaxID=1348616 RepID=A0A9N9F525_9GLOM|nr:6987_t:CDS:2 [Dentiscutata erythropus]